MELSHAQTHAIIHLHFLSLEEIPLSFAQDQSKKQMEHVKHLMEVCSEKEPKQALETLPHKSSRSIKGST